MSEALWLMLAAALSFAGMAWLALAMDVHWAQAMPPPAGKVRRACLRWLGTAALGSSLLACLAADQPSMAVLTWVMLLAVGSTGVALALARRPRLLAVFWPSGAAGRARKH
ncbi:DUF3325 domain-containing protein [Thauera sp. SDU_THAU2]|uniref:DUF3325 domain-containing protein n=1 Tax=Thauera sp. SDU_THAU2 TaxID=3136633 RepID=UPI00311DFBE2